ncbi:MAG: hypothetical protein AABX37_00130 [Nanoarchaeota archaeon]
MPAFIKTYLHSFRQKNILHIFCIDLLFAGIAAFLLFSFGSYIQNKTKLLPPPEQLQQLLTSSPQQAQAAFAGLKSVLVVSLLGAVIIALFLLFSYAYSRAYIWNALLQKKVSQHNYWKWNGLCLVLIIPLLIYLLLILVLTLLFQQVFSLIPSITVINLLNALLKLLYILVFLFFFLLVKYNFTKSYKIWESIGNAFTLLRTKWSSLWRVFITMLITFTIVSLLLTLPPRFVLYNQAVLQVIDIIVFLLFLAWFRVYLVRTLEE